MILGFGFLSFVVIFSFAFLGCEVGGFIEKCIPVQKNCFLSFFFFLFLRHCGLGFTKFYDSFEILGFLPLAHCKFWEW